MNSSDHNNNTTIINNNDVTMNNDNIDDSSSDTIDNVDVTVSENVDTEAKAETESQDDNSNNGDADADDGPNNGIRSKGGSRKTPKSDVRYFKVVTSTTGFSGGRFKGDQPSIAARKAAKSMLKNHDESVATFTIKETTSDRPSFDRGTFKYTAKKIELEEPHEYNAEGKKIIVKHDYKVTSDGKLPKTDEEKKRKATLIAGGMYRSSSRRSAHNKHNANRGAATPSSPMHHHPPSHAQMDQDGRP